MPVINWPISSVSSWKSDRTRSHKKHLALNSLLRPFSDFELLQQFDSNLLCQQDFLTPAVDFMRKAIVLDDEKKYKEAYEMYMNSAEYFATAKKCMVHRPSYLGLLCKPVLIHFSSSLVLLLLLSCFSQTRKDSQQRQK